MGRYFKDFYRLDLSDLIDDLSNNEDTKNDDEDIIEPLVNVITFQIQACSLVVWDDC